MTETHINKEMPGPFDESFCGDLEYAITGALLTSAEKDIRRCWCDGVRIPDEDALSPQNVNNSKAIITQAWIDEGRIKNKTLGQFLYRMTIWFGKRSIKRFRLWTKNCFNKLNGNCSKRRNSGLNFILESP